MRIVIIYLLAITVPALAETQPAPIQSAPQAVQHCVELVHALGGTGFDAFYNPANKTVKNNAFTVGEQPWLFQFEKCMASVGFPLH